MANGKPKPTPPQEIYERNTGRAEIAGWLIVIGLGIELVSLIWAGRPLSEVIPQAIADLLIANGVAFELLFGRLARVAGDSVQAEANARVSEAEAQSKKLELSLAHLRESAGPRMLKDIQQFTSELKDRPTAPVEVMYDPDISDGLTLAFRITAALNTAGWGFFMPRPFPKNPTPPDPSFPMLKHFWLGAPTWGVSILTTDRTIFDDPNSAASAITRALVAQLGSISYGEHELVPTGAIRVLIASRP